MTLVFKKLYFSMPAFLFLSFYISLFFCFFFWVLGIFAFKIWMFVDALLRPEKDYPQKGPYVKLIWTLFILFGSIVGPITYLILVKLKEKKK